MNYPQYKEKYQYDSFISPERALHYKKKQGRLPDEAPPKRVIFSYQHSFFERAVGERAGRFLTGTFRKVYCFKDHPGIAIAEFGVGAPGVVGKIEHLIAWGVKEFISIGTAGAIASDLNIGDLVGCDRALRDEGTSHHYLPPGRYSYPTDGGAFARKFARVGTTWTLDAFFRHTREEIAAYRKEGILTVEMEASALFAVGKVRNVSVGSGFVVSDLLYGDEWEQEMYQPKVETGLDRLLELALDS
jgi:uridine phosphorylase